MVALSKARINKSIMITGINIKKNDTNNKMQYEHKIYEANVIGLM
jgi:hypothetical protein